MLLTLEDSRRIAIAIRLAEMKAIQILLIVNERTLIESYPNQEISERLEDFLRDDQENLSIIDSVITNYGIKAEPKPTVQTEIEQVKMIMKDSKVTLFEKIAKHELFKHTQTMSGLLVHKAAQMVGGDIAMAIAPLNTVNLENRIHQEQLKGMMELLSTLELTGKPAAQGLWVRVQDAIAAFSGVGGGLIDSDREMGICELIRQDHTKVNTIFSHIGATHNPQKLKKYFGQIYRNLSTDFEIKQQVIYPMLGPYYKNIQKLYDQQAEIKHILDLINTMDFEDTVEFKTAIMLLMSAVTAYMEKEENDMFRHIQNRCGDEQQKHMATAFNTTKSQIQAQRLGIRSY